MISNLGKKEYIQVSEWNKSKLVSSFPLAQCLLSWVKYRRERLEEGRTVQPGGALKALYLSRPSSKINIFLFLVPSCQSFDLSGTEEIPATLEEESHSMARGLLGARTQTCLWILNSSFKLTPDKQYLSYFCDKTIPVHMPDQPLPRHLLYHVRKVFRNVIPCNPTYLLQLQG